MIHKFFQLLGMAALGLALTACAQIQKTPQLTSNQAAAPAPWEIVANQGWQKAHGFVHPGDTLEITATGAWSHDPADPQFSKLYGPAGVAVFEPGTILPSAPIGSLVGRIGDNPPFVIGEHLVLTSVYRGTLWLSMNDSPDRFSDNTGSLGVAVRLTPKPAVPGQFLKNIADGYSLVYPTGYYVVITENGICITQGSSQFEGCGPAILEVQDAGGRTAAQIADQLAPRDDPNFQVGPTNSLMIDGEQAARIDMASPDETSFLVTVVHGTRVYIWKFGPFQTNIPAMDPMPDSFVSPAELVQRLYDTLINSFQFVD